jgi:hypothetical protein
MNLFLGMDLSRYGINPENVKEFMRGMHEERKGRREKEKEKEKGKREVEE